MSDHYSDKELIAGIKNEDTCNYYFNLLMRKYQERLYWHIRRMVIVHDDADDVLQNVFIKAWKGLGKFREDANLFTWLYRIATNETITFLNNKKKKIFLPLVNIEKDLAESLESDVFYSGDKIQLKLQKALLKLPKKQRVVFNMKYFDEMKYEDISDVLGTSVGALKASYHHAVQKIETFLKED